MKADIVDRILARPRFGEGLALHRMLWLKERLPHAARLSAMEVIHVTGTNGKGTVTTLTAALLRALGLRVGAFVSPHVSQFAERIVIDGAPIAAPALVEAYRWFEAEERAYCAAHPGESFGAFEAITAIAFHAFAAAPLNAFVLEAGIGGRYDATRAARGRLVALTSVESEHAALLGPSLAHILYDKADLAPEGACLIAGRLAPSLRERLTAYGHLRGVEVLYCDDLAEITSAELAPGKTRATIRLSDVTLNELHLPTTGHVQLWNAAHALCLARALLARTGRPIEPKRFAQAAQRAFRAAMLPLRFEKIADNPEIFADGAHTAGAAQALAGALQELEPARPIVLLGGISAGKEPALLKPLLSRAAYAVLTRPRHRGEGAEQIAAYLRAQKETPPFATARDCAEALDIARAHAREIGGAVLVAGSFYLAAEARALARGEDVAALRFL